MPSDELVEAATLTRQAYGLAMAQGRYGGPTGIWLECTTCPESQVIRGSNSDEWAKIPTEDAAKVFLRHGWTGEGPVLKRAKCPKCSQGGSDACRQSNSWHTERKGNTDE